MPEHISKPLGKFLLLTIVVTYFSVQLHEAGHWMMLQLFGRGPTMGFAGIVQRWDSPPLHPEHWQKITYPELGTGWLRLQALPGTNREWAIMLLAGQLVPLILIAMGMVLYRRLRHSPTAAVWLMLVFVNGAMGFSKLFGFLRGAKGDLYFLSLHVPIDATVLTGIFVLLQLAGFGWAWKQLSLPARRRWGVALVLAYFLIIIPLHILDGYLRQQVNLEHPWFLPVLGWSKPVLVVDAGAILLFVVWWQWIKQGNELSRSFTAFQESQQHNQAN